MTSLWQQRVSQFAPQALTGPELAKVLGITRSRLYQLIARGVMPRPLGSLSRPYFTPEMIEQCLKVKETRMGVNGEVVMFNRRRSTPSSPSQAAGV